MRNAMSAILAMILALALATGELLAAPSKAPPADVGPGRIAWFDITTTNLAKSKEFYGKLFDWQFTAVQGTDQAAEIVAGGTRSEPSAARRARSPPSMAWSTSR
jgi:hypothetical protein